MRLELPFLSFPPPLPEFGGATGAVGRTGWGVLLVLFFILLCSAVRAAPDEPELLPGQRPRFTLSGGIVYRCLFDPGEFDAEDGNTWPDHWQRKRGIDQGIPFPDHLEIGIHEHRNPFGNYVLRMNMQRGGAAVFTPKIPIRRGMSYTVSAFVDAVDVVHDDISILLCFYGKDSATPLRTVASEKIRSTEGWKQLEIGPVVADMQNVEQIALGLFVIPSGRQDYGAVVDFTNIEIRESPTVSLSMPNRHHLYFDPQEIELVCRLDGIDPAQRSIVFLLEDPFGRIIARRNIEMAIGNHPASRFVYDENDHRQVLQGTVSWSHIPVRNRGFYRVRLRTPEEFVRDLQLPEGVFFKDPLQDVPPLTFVVLSRSSFLPDGEFGWNLDGWSLKEIREQQELLKQSGISRLKIPAWGEEKNRDAERRTLNQLCDDLASEQVRIVGLLRPIPSTVRDKVKFGPVNAAAMLLLPPKDWIDSLRPTLQDLSLLVKDWQWTSDDDLSIAELPGFEKRLEEQRRAFDQNDFGFGVGFAWDWNRSPPNLFGAADENSTEMAGSVTENVPRPSRNPPNTFAALTSGEPLTPDDLEHYLREYASGGIRPFVSLIPLSGRDYALEDRILDLVRRMVVGKTAGAEAIFLSRPVDSLVGVLRENGTPGELFLPWRTTSSHLSGRRFLGSVGFPNQSRNFNFRVSDDEVVTVLWNDDATTDKPVFETIYVGESPEIHDVWGRSFSPERRGREQTFPVGPIPLFVTGVDTNLVRLRLGFQLEKKALSGFPRQNQSLPFTMRNDTAFPLTANLSVVAPRPEDWNVVPPVKTLALGSGQTEGGSFEISLNDSANTGRQPIRFDIKTTGAEPREFSVYDSIRIGPEDLSMEFSTRLDRNGDLEVTQSFINNGEKEYTYSCRLYVPQRAYQRMTVTRQGFGRLEHVYVIRKGRELLDRGVREAVVRAAPIGEGEPMVYTVPLFSEPE